MARAAEIYDAKVAANIRRVMIHTRKEVLCERQEEFGRRFEVDQATISRWEKTGQITLKALLTLAPLARTTLDEIAHGERSVLHIVRAALDGGVESIQRAKNLPSASVAPKDAPSRGRGAAPGDGDDASTEGTDPRAKRAAAARRPR